MGIYIYMCVCVVSVCLCVRVCTNYNISTLFQYIPPTLTL